MRERFVADHMAATKNEQTTWWVRFIEDRTVTRAAPSTPERGWRRRSSVRAFAIVGSRRHEIHTTS
jgi:hypothetical protein